jgi:hypothetical protein
MPLSEPTVPGSFAPAEVRYVKLGRGGAWSAQAFAQGIIPVGFQGVDHTLCASGDWAAVKAQFVDGGRSGGGASQGVRELRDVYESGTDCLWFTIADGHLHWAFAEAGVVPVADAAPDQPTRFRRVLGGAWQRHSLTGEALTTRSLSSALLRTASYRMTICKVDHQEYLLRRIRGEPDPLHREAADLQAQLVAVATRIIAQLDWRDFEILIDLILARSGWRRGSALGEGEVDVDLLLDNPSTGETAWVQIKSTASQPTLDDYLGRFTRDGSCQHFFFACHSPTSQLTLPSGPGLHLWTGAALADIAIRSGMFDWLIERTR